MKDKILKYSVAKTSKLSYSLKIQKTIDDKIFWQKKSKFASRLGNECFTL